MSAHNASSLKYEIINHSKIKVAVQQRGGMTTIIPPRGNSGFIPAPCLLNIYFECDLEYGVQFDIEGMTSKVDKVIAEGIIKQVTERQKSALLGTDTPKVSVFLQIELTGVYADESTNITSDLLGITLVQLNNGRNAGFTGVTQAAVVNQIHLDANECESELKGGIGVHFKVVDNHSHLNKLFYNFLGNVKPIPVVRDPNQADGLYYITFQNNRIIHKCVIKIEDLNDDKLGELNIYQDKTSAAAGKNNKLVQQLQSKVKDCVQELEKKTELSKEQHRRALQSIMEQQTLKTEISRLKWDLKSSERLHKLSTEQLKAKSESNRGSDFVKSVIGIGGLLLAGVKAFS